MKWNHKSLEPACGQFYFKKWRCSIQNSVVVLGVGWCRSELNLWLMAHEPGCAGSVGLTSRPCCCSWGFPQNIFFWKLCPVINLLSVISTLKDYVVVSENPVFTSFESLTYQRGFNPLAGLCLSLVSSVLLQNTLPRAVSHVCSVPLMNRFQLPVGNCIPAVNLREKLDVSVMVWFFPFQNWLGLSSSCEVGNFCFMKYWKVNPWAGRALILMGREVLCQSCG